MTQLCPSRPHNLQPVGDESLELALRNAIQARRETETQLQLAQQHGTRAGGAARRLLKENQLPSAQVEEIRGRLLESKLRRIQLAQVVCTSGSRRPANTAAAAQACACLCEVRSKGPSVPVPVRRQMRCGFADRVGRGSRRDAGVFLTLCAAMRSPPFLQNKVR